MHVHAYAHVNGEAVVQTAGQFPGSATAGGTAPQAVTDEKALQGASPKRPREDVDSDDDAVWVENRDREGATFLGGGKRQRSMADLAAWDTEMEERGRSMSIDLSIAHNLPPGMLGSAWEGVGSDVEGADEPPGGASPTARLSEQLQVALGSGGSGRKEDKDKISPREVDQPLPRDGRHHPPAVHADLGSELSSRLQQALRQCIATGALPDVAYPPLMVVRPTPKQRKMLPQDVEFTSPSPLAVAGVARRQSKGSGHNGSQPASEQGRSVPANHPEENGGQPSVAAAVTPETAAQLLLAQLQLPSGVSGVEVANGHLNFKTEAAVAAAAKAEAAPHELPSRPSASPHSVPRNATFAPESVTIATAAAPGALREAHGTEAQGGTHGANGVAIPPAPKRHFELVTLPSGDPSLPAVEFELYKRYQVLHHGDDPASVTLTSFKRFLCESPLLPAPADAYPPCGAPPCGFGSFHQQYWLDGKLVAVGVVDILPKCLSSKYLFWDPELAPLSLGKLASLQEIAWIKEASQSCPSLKYYYLGYYLHTCHRMRYKADFGPSDLLCPVQQCWVPIDRVGAALASGAKPPALATVPGALEGLGPEYGVTSEGEPLAPPRLPTAEEIGAVRLYISPRMGRGQVVKFGTLCSLGVIREEMAEKIRRRLEKWMVLTGPAWQSMIYRL